MRNVTVDNAPAPAPELDNSIEEEDSPAQASDLMGLAVFFSNASLLAAYIISIAMLFNSNLGVMFMVGSFLLSVPVWLLNVKFFFAPRKGESDEEANARSSVAPYVILLAMTVIIPLAYTLISSRSHVYGVFP